RTASRRAGPVAPAGPATTAAAPALVAAPAAKSAGSSSRASTHAGTAVSDTSTPVYVAITGPSTAATSCAARPTRGNDRVISQPAAVTCAAEAATSVHVPTLIGDV